jgi:hypothetical protein
VRKIAALPGHFALQPIRHGRLLSPTLLLVLAITYSGHTTAAELRIQSEPGSRGPSHRSVVVRRQAPVLLPWCHETYYAVLLGCPPVAQVGNVVDPALYASSRAMRAIGAGPYPTLDGR